MTALAPWSLLVVVLGAALVTMVPLRAWAPLYADQTREWFLLGLAWVAALLTFAWHPGLGLIAVAVLVHWQDHRRVPAVLTWAGIIGAWVMVCGLPAAWHPAIAWAWSAVALGEVGLGIVQRWYGFEVKGTMGLRTTLAAYLALVVPFAPPLAWPLYAVGLALTSSFVAWGAVGVALVVMWPHVAIYVAAGALLVVGAWAVPWSRRALIDRTPRGSSLDGLHVRLATWAALGRCIARWPWRTWLVGLGPNAPGLEGTEAAIEVEAARMRCALNTSPIHNEPLELASTFGLLGVAAMVLTAWQLAPHLRLGDPWTASLAAGLTLSLASSPMRTVPVGVPFLVVCAVLSCR